MTLLFDCIQPEHIENVLVMFSFESCHLTHVIPGVNSRIYLTFCCLDFLAIDISVIE
jgi:hypothetical protein